MAGKKGRSGSGGARPGSGPKPKAIKYESARLIAERRIKGWLPGILEALHELALGVNVKEVTEKGEEKVYLRPPDYKAGSYLVDRVLGKPLARIEAEDVTDPANRPDIPNGNAGAVADVVEEVLRRSKEKATRSSSGMER